MPKFEFSILIAMLAEVIKDEEEVTAVETLGPCNAAASPCDDEAYVSIDNYSPELGLKSENTYRLNKRIYRALHKIGKNLRDLAVLLFVSFEVAVLYLIDNPEEDFSEEYEVHESQKDNANR